MERSRLVAIGAPLAMLLVGGALGYTMRGDTTAAPSSGTVVGHPIPTGADLESAAPVRSLPRAANTMVIDTDRLVGLPDDATVAVPSGAALPLTIGGDGTNGPVDAATLAPVEVATRAPLPPVDPAPMLEGARPGTAPTTLPLTDATVAPATTAALADAGFVDACIRAEQTCPGAAGRILDGPSDGTPALDPFQASLPFAATGDFATMCSSIEAGKVPDPFLAPATRPTIAVVVNQPSTIALSGRWADGTSLDKLTMITAPEFDAQWQQTWDSEHRQGTLLACLTLPLDTVRAHASAGRATLSASMLAISATGRAEIGGAVTVAIPLDGLDEPFADQLNVTALGEQRQPDETLAPTVHVHYAFTTDSIIPTTGSVNARTARVYGSHALVENADCAGWAVNEQGLDRTGTSRFTIAFEQRTVAGRNRPVSVVDGDVTLDEAMPGGWEGFLCVQLFVADDAGNRVTVALRGAPVRSPRTAVYTVGLRSIDTERPDGVRVQATWRRPDGSSACGPVELVGGDPGVSCTTYARSAPDGITVMFRGVEPTGALRPAFLVTIPVNTAYCDPDDPTAAVSSGCDTGFVQRLDVPLDATGTESAPVSLTVIRTATPGSFLTNPSHTWQIGSTQSFAF